MSTVNVEVVYALPEQAIRINLQLPAGASLADAITASGLAERFAEIAANECRMGIFSRIMPVDTLLQEGDRVEIYRPLRVDPKEARRRRAAKKSGE